MDYFGIIQSLFDEDCLLSEEYIKKYKKLLAFDIQLCMTLRKQKNWADVYKILKDHLSQLNCLPRNILNKINLFSRVSASFIQIEAAYELKFINEVRQLCNNLITLIDESLKQDLSSKLKKQYMSQEEINKINSIKSQLFYFLFKCDESNLRNIEQAYNTALASFGEENKLTKKFLTMLQISEQKERFLSIQVSDTYKDFEKELSMNTKTTIQKQNYISPSFSTKSNSNFEPIYSSQSYLSKLRSLHVVQGNQKIQQNKEISQTIHEKTRLNTASDQPTPKIFTITPHTLKFRMSTQANSDVLKTNASNQFYSQAEMLQIQQIFETQEEGISLVYEQKVENDDKSNPYILNQMLLKRPSTAIKKETKKQFKLLNQKPNKPEVLKQQKSYQNSTINKFESFKKKDMGRSSISHSKKSGIFVENQKTSIVQQKGQKLLPSHKKQQQQSEKLEQKIILNISPQEEKSIQVNMEEIVRAFDTSFQSHQESSQRFSKNHEISSSKNSPINQLEDQNSFIQQKVVQILNSELLWQKLYQLSQEQQIKAAIKIQNYIRLRQQIRIQKQQEFNNQQRLIKQVGRRNSLKFQKKQKNQRQLFASIVEELGVKKELLEETQEDRIDNIKGLISMLQNIDILQKQFNVISYFQPIIISNTQIQIWKLTGFFWNMYAPLRVQRIQKKQQEVFQMQKQYGNYAKIIEICSNHFDSQNAIFYLTLLLSINTEEFQLKLNLRNIEQFSQHLKVNNSNCPFDLINKLLNYYFQQNKLMYQNKEAFMLISQSYHCCQNVQEEELILQKIMSQINQILHNNFSIIKTVNGKKIRKVSEDSLIISQYIRIDENKKWKRSCQNRSKEILNIDGYYMEKTKKKKIVKERNVENKISSQKSLNESPIKQNISKRTSKVQFFPQDYNKNENHMNQQKQNSQINSPLYNLTKDSEDFIKKSKYSSRSEVSHSHKSKFNFNFSPVNQQDNEKRIQRIQNKLLIIFLQKLGLKYLNLNLNMIILIVIFLKVNQLNMKVLLFQQTSSRNCNYQFSIMLYSDILYQQLIYINSDWSIIFLNFKFNENLLSENENLTKKQFNKIIYKQPQLFGSFFIQLQTFRNKKSKYFESLNFQQFANKFNLQSSHLLNNILFDSSFTNLLKKEFAKTFLLLYSSQINKEKKQQINNIVQEKQSFGNFFDRKEIKKSDKIFSLYYGDKMIIIDLKIPNNQRIFLKLQKQPELVKITIYSYWELSYIFISNPSEIELTEHLFSFGKIHQSFKKQILRYIQTSHQSYGKKTYLGYSKRIQNQYFNYHLNFQDLSQVYMLISRSLLSHQEQQISSIIKYYCQKDEFSIMTRINNLKGMALIQCIQYTFYCKEYIAILIIRVFPINTRSNMFQIMLNHNDLFQLKFQQYKLPNIVSSLLKSLSLFFINTYQQLQIKLPHIQNIQHVSQIEQVFKTPEIILEKPYLKSRLRNLFIIYRKIKYINNHFLIITVQVDTKRKQIIFLLYIPKYSKYFKCNMNSYDLKQLNNETLEKIIPSSILENIESLNPKINYRGFHEKIRELSNNSRKISNEQSPLIEFKRTEKKKFTFKNSQPMKISSNEKIFEPDTNQFKPFCSIENKYNTVYLIDKLMRSSMFQQEQPKFLEIYFWDQFINQCKIILIDSNKYLFKLDTYSGILRQILFCDKIQILNQWYQSEIYFEQQQLEWGSMFEKFSYVSYKEAETLQIYFKFQNLENLQCYDFKASLRQCFYNFPCPNMDQIKINSCITILQKVNNYLVQQIEFSIKNFNHSLYFNKYDNKCMQAKKSNRVKNQMYFYLEIQSKYKFIYQLVLMHYPSQIVTIFYRHQRFYYLIEDYITQKTVLLKMKMKEVEMSIPHIKQLLHLINSPSGCIALGRRLIKTYKNYLIIKAYETFYQ